MPFVTCPDCLAKFESSGARSSSCPTCGRRLGSSRRSDDAPRRSVRRREYEDDYDDHRPVRRPRRERSTAADSLVPLLILGGVLFVVLFVGGVGFVVYRVVERAPSGPADVAEVRPVVVGPMGFAPAAPPDDGLPGVNPADLAPGGPPAFGPPPSAPRPNDPSVPGIDPGQLQPPPGLPRPPSVPVGPPPGFAPRPGGPRGPGRPATPQPPAMPQPPGAAATVTLSNLRQGSGAGTTLEVDYEYTAGARHPVFDKLIVRTANGISEVNLSGPMRKTGTFRIRAVGGIGPLQGKVEVWMERRSATTLPGARGQVISNTVSLD
jgi:hypothetical protein